MNPASRYYDAQKSHRDHDDRKDFAESWLKAGTIDAWRHNRMLSLLEPLLAAHPGASWLTVGDGRFASDTRYILARDPTADVTTSDLSEPLMAEALRRGFIQKYSVENCEMLSFPDDQFDFVLCKESYHHFPRPYLALYEMIRVARKAVILIEPNDSVLAAEYFQQYIAFTDGRISTKDLLRSILRKLGLLSVWRRLRGLPAETQLPETMAEFEPSGNFLYGLSEREMEKVALGIGLPVVAFSSLNDYYEEGVEFEEASPQSPLFQKVQQRIAEADAQPARNILCTILFHSAPGETLTDLVKKRGMKVKELPANPHHS